MTWEEFYVHARALRLRHLRKKYVGVYGIPTGGSILATYLVSQTLELRMLDTPIAGALIVDDLVDSGATARAIMDGELAHENPCITFDALIRKPYSPSFLAPNASTVEGWVTFPWEHEQAPEDSVRRLLQYVGENVDRDGLKGTPDRVCRALKEMTSGYSDDPKTILSRVFEEPHDQMIVLRGIEFTSLCEHHLLPFTGVATVGYLPGTNGKVVGLSKLARLVDCFARRLQNQERLTSQIATALVDHLGAMGAGVILRAHHSCMGCRGVRKPSAEMVTSAMLGNLRSDPSARAELLTLAR